MGDFWDTGRIALFVVGTAFSGDAEFKNPRLGRQLCVVMC
jgi:hypothetical protein